MDNRGESFCHGTHGGNTEIVSANSFVYERIRSVRERISAEFKIAEFRRNDERSVTIARLGRPCGVRHPVPANL